MRLYRLLLLLCAATLFACDRFEDEPRQTPTPFTAPVATQRLVGNTPIPVSLSDLANNPSFYEGALLQLSGQYQRLPRLVCQGEGFQAPASWGLADGQLLANASGYNRQVRELLAENQPMTVEGRWLRWRGPVGCGKNARSQDVWYLSVARIVEPHPLLLERSTTVALALPVEEIILAEDPTEIPLETPTVLSATVTAQATETMVSPSPEPIIPTLTPIPNETPQIPLTATLPAILTATSVVSQTMTPDPLNPSPTAPAGTPNPAQSATPGGPATATVTQTTTPTSGDANQVLERGTIDYEDLNIDTIQANERHSWAFVVSEPDTVKLMVAPSSGVNPTISIIDPSGSVLLDRHNVALAGEVEMVADFSIASPGTYKAVVDFAGGGPGDYAIMPLAGDSYDFVFRGSLQDGVSRNESLPEESDHFWFFSALGGESVSVEVVPVGSADPYLELYGPDSSRLITVDNTDSGEAETLQNFTVLEDGLYAFRVGEFDFAAMTYEITLSRP